MDLIRSYAGLAMVCGAVMLLLPQGGLRRTASLAMGLTLALFWLHGITSYFHFPEIPEAPDTLLTPVVSQKGG